MSYTCEISHVLQEYDGNLYKMILVKIVNSNGNFAIQESTTSVIVDDGSNQAYNFMYNITGNKKELHAYFTTDAFTGFGSSSTVKFTTALLGVEKILGVDVTAILALPTHLTSYTYTDADSTWLSNL